MIKLGREPYRQVAKWQTRTVEGRMGNLVGSSPTLPTISTATYSRKCLTFRAIFDIIVVYKREENLLLILLLTVIRSRPVAG